MVERIKAEPNRKPPLYREARDDGRSGSRLSRGRDLLPNEDGRSRWARLLKSTLGAIIAHCGGADRISDMQLMAARRVAALEAELIYHEDRIASLRRQGKEPSSRLLHSYATLANQQLRISKQIGWDRYAKPVNATPDLQSYLASRSGERGRNGHAVVIDHD